MMRSAHIHALAVSYPSVLRTNDYWRRHHPEMIEQAQARGVGKVWTAPKDPDGPSALFDTAMAPYLDDPFRGTRDRRVLGPGETGLGLEVDAARKVLDAAGLGSTDPDLAICVSFQPTSYGVGNAVYLANELGLTCPAINLETACSGALVAFQTACAYVSAGHYDRVLVTVSCTYSIQCEPSNPLSLTSADGAAAFLVTPAPEGSGYLGGKTINTAITCGAMYFEVVLDPPDRTPASGSPRAARAAGCCESPRSRSSGRRRPGRSSAPVSASGTSTSSSSTHRRPGTSTSALARSRSIGRRRSTPTHSMPIPGQC
ncbi:MAG: hypothetical protein M5U28_15555 [Sandaracinaceae bacterium]|nr:hypothetical protein [Sandaracinaceae bacterium]